VKIQSLGYILVETKNLSAWDHYGQEVCGFMKHPDFSDAELLCSIARKYEKSSKGLFAFIE